MSNYYVRRSGEDDYLEHAGGWKWSKPTKYIDKFMKNGRWVYVYNQARNAAGNVRGAVRGAVSAVRRKGLGRAVADATGITARNAYRQARTAAARGIGKGNSQVSKSLLRSQMRAKNAYDKSLLGRIENAGRNARKAVGQAAGQARRAGASFVGSIAKNTYNVADTVRRKGVGKAVADASGYTARKAYKQASSAANKGIGRGNADVSKSLLRSKTRAKNAYDRTLLGRAERGFNDYKDWTANNRRKAKNAIGGARRKVKRKWLQATGWTRKG